MLREYKVVLVTSFAFSKWSEDVVPTVAFNFRKVRKGNIVLKIWDVAGAGIRRSLSVVLPMKSRPAKVSLHVGTLLPWS